ncbi:restriction endonuclease subunit S [Vibrio cholerae]|nr:restriction endonuclease subunit S [Vibrio cholerae]EKF9162531.1 restriction endonuclease subunit S [Vibrio cholerae]EKF9982413.1 restriction endonuclease subunit S [Vibrio cholerae]
MGSNPVVTAKLSDLCELIVDCPHSTPKWTDSGFVVLRNQNIRNGALDLTSPSYTDEAGYNSRIKRAVPQAGDIVITREAPMGEVCIIPEGLQCCLGQRQVLLRPKKGISNEYLFWALQSPFVKHQISWNEGTGTTVSNIRIPVLKAFEIPRWFEQEPQIAAQLSAIDNKITLNRQINQTLEQMAQALFKSWFVDFDPVMDNALDAGNPIPDELQHRAEARQAVRESEGFNPLPDDVRQLFPDAFEESELGWVPKGWEVTMLGDMCVELRRGISPKYIEEGGIKVINQKCIRNHEVNYDLARRNNPELRKVDGREVQLGDVLVNSTGVGTLGRMAQVTYIPEPTVVDSHVTLVRVNSDICPMYTFGQLLLSIENRVERLGEGSTGQTELSRKILSEQQVVLPPLTIANHIEATFKSFADKKVASRNEVDSLTKLRDTLLPKLISGELRLDEVELAVEQEAVSAEQQNER